MHALSDCSWTSSALLCLQSGPNSIMSAGRRKAAVFAAGLCLRLVLLALFPTLPDLLTGRVEISTPINSFKRRESGHSIN